MDRSIAFLSAPVGKSIFPLLVCLCALISIGTDHMIWMFIPLGILFVWISVVRLHWIYYLLLVSIPFSTEIELPGDLGTDFPDEPLMWWLFGLGSVFLITRRFQDLITLSRHPLSMLLAFHWLWILCTSIMSTDPILSMKFWLSKTWYIFVFYVMTFVFLKNTHRLRWFALLSLLTAALSVLIIEIRHGLTGFAFNTINEVVRPFYRNHVNYACLLVCVLPFLYPLIHSFRQKPWIRYSLLFVGIILLIGIAFSYTRAAYVALFSIVFIYPILKFKLLNFVSVASIILICVGLFYYVMDNKYLELAPDYNQAVTHTNFSSLLEATPQGKDISTMERLYRWVAGIRMTQERALIGYGPSNFVQNYEPFTLHQFATYVSDNPEQSTIHNYYLMTAVEQGIPGLLFFLILLYGYFKTAQYALIHLCPELQTWVIATLWSTGTILIILLFNDMIETDKVGSYFFINLAILVRLIQMSNDDRRVHV